MGGGEKVGRMKEKRERLKKAGLRRLLQKGVCWVVVRGKWSKEGINVFV